ncbi:MAG: tungsten formylmethanofuran dehydrogenase [Saprospiraceae bacterium]|nr:tungsten formylmethanofuran dehydrogenase [Saprospiraceae bacterium]
MEAKTFEETIDNSILTHAFKIMYSAKFMAELYEDNFKLVSKYVHATSRGHEAIQIACGIQLKPCDYVFPYYRDDALMLALGATPYQMMLQLLAKRDDPFSGGRSYYCHPSLKDDDKPKIPHQSSATGMQAIPATGAALGMLYKEQQGIDQGAIPPIVVCSIGDAAVTEGEVSEAFQMAALKQLPIIFLVQDNNWDISAYKDEVRTWNAAEYANGINGLDSISIDGTNFVDCYKTIQEIFQIVRTERRPFILHAKVPLLNHHTSGVRKEWYRFDLEEESLKDPYPKFVKMLINQGYFNQDELEILEKSIQEDIKSQFLKAQQAEEPRPEDLYTHIFAPTPVIEEKGNRHGTNNTLKNMVDSGIFAIREIMLKDERCVFYGQDVGARLGGVFREAATLAEQFGDHRVFNTPIQEAFIIGSTVGMSAVGLKPIVEVQFADYIWPGLNQLFSEVSRSNYLSNGKWPVSMVLRVPVGAYGSGGPYHSSSVETIVANIRGVKIVYPTDAADLKGLMKAAYEDPNPVVMFEHKGLYWAKLPGTENAKCIEADEEYIVPIGKANVLIESPPTKDESTCTIIAYGMGVHWAYNAEKQFPGRIEIIDLRSLVPLDIDTIYQSVRKTNRCLVITEEAVDGSYAQSIAARIQENCFNHLDAPVRTIGSANVPAVPLNEVLEKTMLLNIDKVTSAINSLLSY